MGVALERLTSSSGRVPVGRAAAKGERARRARETTETIEGILCLDERKGEEVEVEEKTGPASWGGFVAKEEDIEEFVAAWRETRAIAREGRRRRREAEAREGRDWDEEGDEEERGTETGNRRKARRGVGKVSKDDSELFPFFVLPFETSKCKRIARGSAEFGNLDERGDASDDSDARCRITSIADDPARVSGLTLD